MNEAGKIEAYLLNSLPVEERLLMDAQLLLNEELREKVMWQKRTYELIGSYGRLQVKSELNDLHRELFSSARHRSFRERVLALFR